MRQKYTVHVPFRQYEVFEVEADDASDAIKITRESPEKCTSINTAECAEYDWGSAVVRDAGGACYDSFGKKF